MSDTNSNTGSPDSKTVAASVLAVRPNAALRTQAQMPSEVRLRLSPQFMRHNKQLAKGKIAKLNSLIAANESPDLRIDATEYCACYEVDANAQKAISVNQEPIFRSHLYLFNMVIAFEWQPSDRTIQRIQLATKKASDFLYDVTDGFMAIGQVFLAGPDLLDVADIQVMASNRFHPRSWISALHEPHKFQPIRLGRGLWRKDQGFVVPWDESDAYRVLVHEWGHYALELVDEYLDLVQLDRDNDTQSRWRASLAKQPVLRPQTKNSLDIVAPSVAPPIDSIMSTLASSELIPRHGPRGDKQRKYMQQKLQCHFPKVALDNPMEGPSELPLPDLPIYKRVDASTTSEEVQLSSEHLAELRGYLTSSTDPKTSSTRSAKRNSSDLEIPDGSWVYVLKNDASEPRGECRIVGQGVLVERDWEEGFMLLGAAVGDQVVVVAQTIDTAAHTSNVKVIRGDLRLDEDGKLAVDWAPVTPEAPPDFIDVLPAEIRSVATRDDSQLPTRLRIQIETREPLPEILISALGEPLQPVACDPASPIKSGLSYPDGKTRSRWISGMVESNHLDGHILLRWADGSMYICGYSHGGGPCTGGGGRCVCYTAGSYEGNSMLFYRDNYDASDRLEPQLDADPIGDQGTRIVSTVMQGGLHYLAPFAGAPEARSYTFSLGSNQPLNKHSATLVLYYDDDARQPDGDLLIYRWSQDNSWQQLTTYAPANQSYVCIPLDQATPETSGGANGRPNEFFDRYRIYWTPR